MGDNRGHIMGRTTKSPIKRQGCASSGKMRTTKTNMQKSLSIVNMFRRQRQQQNLRATFSENSSAGKLSRVGDTESQQEEDSDIEIIDNITASNRRNSQERQQNNDIQLLQQCPKQSKKDAVAVSKLKRKRKTNTPCPSAADACDSTVTDRSNIKQIDHDHDVNSLVEHDSEVTENNEGNPVESKHFHHHQHKNTDVTGFTKAKSNTKLSLKRRKLMPGSTKEENRTIDSKKEKTGSEVEISESTSRKPSKVIPFSETSAVNDQVAHTLDSGSGSTVVGKAINNDDLHKSAQNVQNEAATREAQEQEQSETGEDKSAQDGGEGHRVPYYLENFTLILESMTEDAHYWKLFSVEDRDIIKIFQNLSESGKKLYVRLFQRKVRWLREGQIEYKNIDSDIAPVLLELVDCGLLLDESSLTDMEEILTTLPAPDLRTLAKSLRLSTTEQRTAITEAVLQHAKKKSISSFFNKGNNSDNQQEVNKRARGLLGCCYRIHTPYRWVFMRAMMLFSLHRINGDEDETGNSLQLFQMLMINIGQIKYPKYTIDRQTEVFQTREEMMRFCSAVQLEADIREAMEANNIDWALSLFEQAKQPAWDIITNAQQTEHAAPLPEHLRLYTAGSVYVRILSKGIEALQKARQYAASVTQLQQLIDQTVYHLDYRGRWYERLALNVHSHLKQPERALGIIRQGLKDEHVRAGHRYTLWQRAQKICSSPSLVKLHPQWVDFQDDVMATVQEAPKVTIEGRQLAVPGVGMQWCTEDSVTAGGGEVTFIKRVEDVALRHYSIAGYPEGIHGEGGTILFMFTLLLWDELFRDIPDAFISPHQAAPLDLRTDHFYPARKDLLDTALGKIRQATAQELAAELEKSWTEHEGTFCHGVNWERFESLESARHLVQCIGGAVLAAIFERQVKNMRHTQSGFPDLVVWNTDTGKFKVVEVKGPGDRLSTKQILWLDYLLNLGVDAEVCHVVAVGTKKLRTF